jgi:phage-related protein
VDNSTQQEAFFRTGNNRGNQNPKIKSVKNERLAKIYNILYILKMTEPKPIEFMGNALDDLRAFPLLIRRDVGYQLNQVQHGDEPDDWKPMPTIGKGVREIRVRDASGAFRVVYVAKFANAVYVLHCFQKKTQKTSKADLDLAKKRLSDLEKELKQ